MSKSIAIEPGLLELLQKVAGVRFFLRHSVCAVVLSILCRHLSLERLLRVARAPFSAITLLVYRSIESHQTFLLMVLAKAENLENTFGQILAIVLALLYRIRDIVDAL